MNAAEIQYDALVVGGGPAGLLAATVLGRHGLAVACVEMRRSAPAPQSHHVHLFPAAALSTIDAWMPGFTNALVAHGAVSVDASGHLASNGDRYPHPSRAVLDKTLRAMCEQQVIDAKVLTIERTSNGWCVRLDDGSKLAGHRLIDASGQARRSLRCVTANARSKLVLHEGPRTGSYLSAVVTQLDAGSGLGVLRIRGDEHTPGLLGVRLTDREWQLTLQFAAGMDLPSWDTAIAALPRSIKTMFKRHRRLTSVRQCGGQRSTFLDTDDAHRPTDWLPVGDALLCTPPYQGNGLANIVAQLRCIDEGLAAGSTFEQIRDRVWEEAQSLWMRATMLDAMSNPAILQSLAATQHMPKNFPDAANG